MKLVNLSSATLFAILLSCQSNNEPSYSIVPYIENRDFKFIPGNINYNKPDTMMLKLYLRDGDFDLGLDNTNDSAPFNSMFVLNKNTGQLIPVNDIPADHSNIVLYRDRKTIDTLPPLSCSRWKHYYGSYDTAYYLTNRNFYNISVNLQYQDTDLAWKYFDANSYFTFVGLGNCPPEYFFDGRFIQPKGNYFAGPFIYQAISSKEGTLTYSMASFIFSIIFKGKKIKLNYYIQDRALHRSNVIETPIIQIN